MCHVYRSKPFRVLTSIWDSEPFSSMDSDSIYFWLYCSSSPRTNYLGCFYLTPEDVQEDLGWSQEKVQQAFKICEQHQVIRYEQSWLFIPGFLKANEVKSVQGWHPVKGLLQKIPQALSFYPALLEEVLIYVKCLPPADEVALKQQLLTRTSTDNS